MFDRLVQPATFAAVIRYALAAIAVVVALSILDRMIARDRNAERIALNERATALTARAMAPGSALACLDPSAGEIVVAACEQAVFATPQTVASAVAYTAARLDLLAEGQAFAERSDADYTAHLAALRRAIEADPFGIVAHVLGQRPDCTAARCPQLALLANPGRIRANLARRTFAGLVQRHAAVWQSAPGAPTAVAPQDRRPGTGDVPPALSAVPNLSFPSADTIPPVSIMTAEPDKPSATGKSTPAGRNGKPQAR